MTDRTDETYRDLAASALFCSRCEQAVPVRQRLLLVLPDGELFEYVCQMCADSLGTKKVVKSTRSSIIIP
jgi:hypothetical protein